MLDGFVPVTRASELSYQVRVEGDTVYVKR